MINRGLATILLFFSLACGLEIAPLSDSARSKSEATWREFCEDTLFQSVFGIPDSVTKGLLEGGFVEPLCADTTLEMMGKTYTFVYALPCSSYCVIVRGDRFIVRALDIYSKINSRQIAKKLADLEFYTSDKISYQNRSILITYSKRLVEPDVRCLSGKLTPPFSHWTITPK